MSNTALGLTALLLVIPIIISYKEGLHIIKDLIVATLRAVVQLIILGFYYIIFLKLTINGYLYCVYWSLSLMHPGIRLVEHHR